MIGPYGLTKGKDTPSMVNIPPMRQAAPYAATFIERLTLPLPEDCA